MWTSTDNLEVRATPRPTRLAYLVPVSPPQELLDEIFSECFRRWGGRRTPVIKTDGSSIAAGDWAFLDYWDADIIYSYVPLSADFEDLIFQSFAPSEIKIHRTAAKPNTKDLRPDYSGNYELVSSLSLLPLFARRAAVQDYPRPFVADYESSIELERDAQDTFGLLSESFVGQPILPYADRATVGEAARGQGRDDAPSHTISFSRWEEFFEAMASRRNILSLSGLSDMFCPYLAPLESGRNGWTDHLTIVVGDSVDDRLLYWNAQHRYRSSEGQRELHVLRISAERLADKNLGWIKKWVTLHGHHLSGNQAPRTKFKSASVPKERLEELIERLSLPNTTMMSAESIQSASLFSAEEFAEYQYARPSLTNPRFFTWHSPRQNASTTIKYDRDKFDVPMVKPWHIANFDYSPRSWGAWATDLTINRAENHSLYDNVHHHWWFPRRIRMDGVHLVSYGSPNMVLPPVCRPTSVGDLTIWDDAAWSRSSIRVPRDLSAFMNGIANFPTMAPRVRRAEWSDKSRRRYRPIRISDKGRDLLGTFQFFKSLPEALSYLTDPFWRKVFDNLSFTPPAEKQRNIADISSRLKDLMDIEKFGDADVSRLAVRALELAQRSYEASAGHLTTLNFEQLYKIFQEGQGNDQRNERFSSLEDSLTYLRDQGFMWQGFKWTCRYCQHHNWIDLESLTPVVECEICRHTVSSRVSGSLDFRLNPFAHHAFASSSAQGPVIWCINQLFHRAQHSFGIAPAMDLFNPETGKQIGDIDLSANVDGKIYLVEIKSSFAGVTPAALSQIETIAHGLRPDVLMLAVASKLEQQSDVGKLLAAFAKKFASQDVQFELLHVGNARNIGDRSDIALPWAKQMTWSA